MLTLKLNDKEYPYIETMGAMVAFKTEEGVEITEVKPTDISRQVKYMYLVLRGAHRHLDRGAFPFTFDEFCAALTADEFLRIQQALAQEVRKRISGTEDEKNA